MATQEQLAKAMAYLDGTPYQEPAIETAKTRADRRGEEEVNGIALSKALAFMEKPQTTLKGPMTQADIPEEDFNMPLRGPERASKPQKQYTPGEGMSSDAGIASDYIAAMNDTILDTLGLPGDILKWGQESVGYTHGQTLLPTSEETRAWGSKVGIGYPKGENPQSAAYNAGQYTIIGAEFLAPWLIGGRGAMIEQGGKQFMQSKPKQIAETIAKPFYQAPKTSAAIEAATSTAAGVTGYYVGDLAADLFGEEHRAGGEFIGSLGTATAPLAASTVELGMNIAKKNLFPFTRTGGEMKAQERMKSVIQSTPEETLAKYQAAQKEVLEGTTFTPGDLTRDPYIQGLENVIKKGDPTFVAELQRHHQENYKAAYEALTSMGNVSQADKVQLAVQARVGYLNDLITKQVDDAAKAASDLAGKIPPSSKGYAEIGKRVTSQIRKVLDDARAQEDVEWSSVQKGMFVRPDNAKMAVKELLTKFRDNKVPDKEIPDYITEHFGRLNKAGQLVPPKTKLAYGEEESVSTLHNLYSRLGKLKAKNEAADAPDWDYSRRIDVIRKALLDDMDNEMADTNLKAAIAYSRSLHERFDKGVVHTILKNQRMGSIYAPEMVTDKISGNGIKLYTQVQEMLSVAPEMRTTLSDYIRAGIANSNVISQDPSGVWTINVKNAHKYIDDNYDTLKIFPEIRKQLEDAMQRQWQAQKKGTLSKEALSKVDKSPLGRLSKVESPDKVFQRILTTQDPEKTVLEVIKVGNQQGVDMTRREVIEALKGEAINHLLYTARNNKGGGRLDIDPSVRKLDGHTILEQLDSKATSKAYGQIFSSAERGRLRVIANTLIKNEQLQNLPETEVAQKLASNPSRVLRFIVTLMGTKIGAKLAGGTQGASLKAAAAGSKEAGRTVDAMDVQMANKILKDSITNEETFKMLLTKTTDDIKLKKVLPKFRAWMAGTVIESLRSTAEFESE